MFLFLYHSLIPSLQQSLSSNLYRVKDEIDPETELWCILLLPFTDMSSTSVRSERLSLVTSERLLSNGMFIELSTLERVNFFPMMLTEKCFVVLPRSSCLHENIRKRAWRNLKSCNRLIKCFQAMCTHTRNSILKVVEQQDYQI